MGIKDLMWMNNDLKQACEELHEYLVTKLGHQWRLATWEKKYFMRIREYGLEDCKTAVDGFCSIQWYVENLSHNAPDLIFRSGKQVEKFLAAGMKEREALEEIKEHEWQEEVRKRKAEERAAKRAAFRAKLELENAALTKRFHERIAPLYDELNEASLEVWIQPLLYVGMEGNTVVLFHDYPDWVQKYYGELLAKTIGRPVRVINGVE